jgi:hypothetical protein
MPLRKARCCMNERPDLRPEVRVWIDKAEHDYLAVEGRYPGDWEPITPDEARMAFAMAGQVREAVRSLLA